MESPFNLLAPAWIDRGFVGKAAGAAARLGFVHTRPRVSTLRKRAGGGTTGRFWRVAFLASPDERGAEGGHTRKRGFAWTIWHRNQPIVW